MHLILFTHGSRDPRWIQSFTGLYDELKKRTGAGNISLAFMEFATPTLSEVIQKAHAAGERSFKVLPLFLASGVHLSEDLPFDLAEIKKDLPDVDIKILPAIGEHPRMRELMLEIIINNAAR